MFTAISSVPSGEAAAPPGGVLGVFRQAQAVAVAVVLAFRGGIHDDKSGKATDEGKGDAHLCLREGSRKAVFPGGSSSLSSSSSNSSSSSSSSRRSSGSCVL